MSKWNPSFCDVFTVKMTNQQIVSCECVREMESNNYDKISLTTKNFGGSVTRHQETRLKKNGQRNQKYNSLRQKVPMVGIAIILSGRNDLCQFCVVFTAFFKLFTRLLTASRHWKTEERKNEISMNSIISSIDWGTNSVFLSVRRHTTRDAGMNNLQC